MSVLVRGRITIIDARISKGRNVELSGSSAERTVTFINSAACCLHKADTLIHPLELYFSPLSVLLKSRDSWYQYPCPGLAQFITAVIHSLALTRIKEQNSRLTQYWICQYSF